MSNRVFKYLLLMLSLMVMELRGEVYLRTGVNGGSGGVRSVDVGGMPGAVCLMEEPVRYNGVDTVLRVYRLGGDWENLLRELERMTGVKGEKNPLGEALVLKGDGKWRQILLLCGDAGWGGVTIFDMRLPEKMQGDVEWPRELPMPSKGEASLVIYFKKSKSVLGAFRDGGDRRDMMLSLGARLSGMGFSAVTSESGGRDGGKGEIYVRSKPKGTLVLTLGDDGTGTMLLR